MTSLRVVDSAGNSQNYQVDAIPRIGELALARSHWRARIGELVVLVEGGGETTVQIHYYRVKDVLHSLQGEPGHQVSILLGEATQMNWPVRKGAIIFSRLSFRVLPGRGSCALLRPCRS